MNASGASALVVLSIAFALCSSSARAEPADAAKKAAAQALFDEARRLSADKRFDDACPKYAESLRLDATIGTRFYLADCLEHTGKLASAWTYYIEVADAARAAGQEDRAKYATDRAAGIKDKIPKLTLAVSDEIRTLPGLEIKRDGIVVGEAQWGLAIPVDPGEHAIVVRAQGKEPWEKSVDVKGADTVSIEIPALTDAEPQPTKEITPPKPPEHAKPPPPPPPPPSGSGQRIAGFTLGAVGLAAVGVGSAFGIIAMGKQSESNEGGHCDAANTCDPTGLLLRSEAIDAATLSTVGFLVGAGALVGGAVLLITAPKKSEKTPELALSPGGVWIKGKW